MKATVYLVASHVYSREIVERRLYAAKKEGLVFTRLPRDRSIEIASKLEDLRRVNGRLLPDQGLARALDDKEHAFIRSELLLCKMDFEYFFTRYYNLEIDPGVLTGEEAITKAMTKIAPPTLLPSQIEFIRRIGEREEVCQRELKEHRFTTGIRALFHKVRQVAATATARGLTWHRNLFWSGTRSFCASLDDERVGELFRRDIVAIDRLPFWMKPDIYPNVKNSELGFTEPISSRCLYQAEKQTSGGLGVGTQQDIVHLTEVALWENPGYIKFSLLPAVPKAITSLIIFESTSNGKGNYWHEISEDVRNGAEGYEDWIYSFIPWYLNATKYRLVAPANWTPKTHTVKHANLIERTSPEFCRGVTFHPNRNQLYWWEQERAGALRSGELAGFLTNHPATPEQSFQSPNNGALPAEFIERVEADVMMPGAHFEFDMAGSDNV